MPKVKINGVELFYEIKGNQKAEQTIIFMNGVMASANSWDAFIPIFEKAGYKVIVHDFRGQFLSEKPESEYTFELHVQDTIALLDHLDIEKAHFITTSYGGITSIFLTLSHPKRVKSLILIDTASELDPNFQIKFNGLADIIENPTPEKKNIHYDQLVPYIYGKDYVLKNRENISARKTVVANLPDDFYRSISKLYRNAMQNSYATDRIHEIKCPVFIVCGEDDISTPLYLSKIMASKIKQAELCYIPFCGHVSIMEQPEVLKSMMLGFVIKNS